MCACTTSGCGVRPGSASSVQCRTMVLTPAHEDTRGRAVTFRGEKLPGLLGVRCGEQRRQGCQGGPSVWPKHQCGSLKGAWKDPREQEAVRGGRWCRRCYGVGGEGGSRENLRCTGLSGPRFWTYALEAQELPKQKSARGTGTWGRRKAGLGSAPGVGRTLDESPSGGAGGLENACPVRRLSPGTREP